MNLKTFRRAFSLLILFVLLLGAWRYLELAGEIPGLGMELRRQLAFLIPVAAALALLLFLAGLAAKRRKQEHDR